ncbi:prolyl oligopeptidase family serine peptidase [Microbacterium rhizomatis]|uniref:S9 family peptidase n=1 Tax=Microbacterium rhizomatis TaxID=1631477 RepID=A0A5J5J5X6_9MICO|nr:prolyl oligopeptidase family serine peptidase [Microbacterium rhizomatis]KAA9111556.1 S9 family peptidase [Microbacterium rhizomatis]
MTRTTTDSTSGTTSAPTTDAADEPADPYLWLEEVRGDDALAWAAERSAETEARFASAARSALQERLRGILDDPDRLVVPSRHGEWMYDVWRDAQNPRGLWRRCGRDAFRAGTPEWQVLLDIDALGRAEGTTWSFSRAIHGPAGTDRVLLQLSPDGGDATVLREFDLATVAFVTETPFALDVEKTSVAWISADELLVATALAGGGSTDSGYPLTARVWQRGTPVYSGFTAIEAATTDVGVFVSVDRTDGMATATVDVAHDFFHSEEYVWDAALGAAPKLVAAPQDALVAVHGASVVIRTTTAWTVAGHEVAAGSLLVGPLETVTDGDGSGLEVVFTPTSTTVLDSWRWTKRRLVLTLLDDVQSRMLALDPSDGWRATDLDLGASPDDLLSAGVATADADEDDELWIVVRGFLTPPTLIVTDAVDQGPTTVARSRETFDATALAATQHWAVSADGTRIPYFEVGPREHAAHAPVLMNGYGGFEHALTPEYPTLVGPAWLESGGVYVVANIRGGGEFGPAWHLAALRENRHKAYEDFAAVAADLVDRGVTTADRIGCHGRSNGGLLVGNMLTQFPERFGAIVCGVPLLDMRRYTRLSAGASWIAEYGDPDDPADWEFVRTFSPYHLIDPGRAYPPSLIYAATSDDRVGPAQARKMAARLLADTDAQVHYLEPVEGGHAGTIENAATAALHATIYAFLDEVLVRRPA